jgi:PPM family protein phosphatase
MKLIRLGFDAHIISTTDYIETGESPFLPGDTLLLCSDGLTDMITRDQITSALTSFKSLQEKGRALIQAANDAGGNDNITVVLVHNNKRAVKQKAIQPATTVKTNEDKIEEPKLEQSLPVIPTVQYQPPGRSNRGVILLLSVLCCLFLGAFLWMLWKSNTVEDVQGTALPAASNPQEKHLSDTINNLQGSTLVLSDSSFAREITISDTLSIQRDSLHLKGSINTIFVRDSTYAGPAFVISKDCKYVLLENLTLKYFDVGILAQSRVLRLKNVLFENCRIPLQYQFLFPDNEVINGTIIDTALFTSQSFE